MVLSGALEAQKVDIRVIAEPFQCLVVRQPWAWALVSGAKDIENRSWKTDYRGPLIIQAGAAKTVVNQLVKTGGAALPAMEFAYGSLIGVVDLVDVVPMSEELESNPWAWGPYCWRIANSRRFVDPIPAKGKLKLFTLPLSVSSRVSVAVESARGPQANAAPSAWANLLTHLDTVDTRYEGLFDSYLALDDAPNLMRLAENAVSQRGDSAAFVDRATAKYIGEDDEAALADANHAIAVGPLNASAFLIRSDIYSALGKKKMANDDRRKAEELLKNQPSLPDSQDNAEE